MRISVTLLLIAMLGGMVRAGEAPTSRGASGLSPAVQEALGHLSDENFTVREKALRDLQVAFGEQARDLLGPADPESQARVAALLQFSEGLNRWILNALKLPEPRRHALLAFGLGTEMLPIVAKLASPTVATRIEGIHDLARVEDPGATDLLAPLLDDNDRAVYVAAMEAAWDRKPTDMVVDALWERAVEAGFAMYTPQVNNQADIYFHGQLLGPTFFDNAAYRRMQDSNVATDVLIHLDSPRVGEKLAGFFEHVQKTVAEAPRRGNRVWMFGPNSAPMKNVYTLLNAYRPRAAFGALFQLATGPLNQPVNGQVNKVKYFWSNRTQPLATLVLLTDQDPAVYKVRQITQPNGAWAFGSQAEEEAAIAKLRGWGGDHPQFATTEPGTGEDGK